MKARLFRIGDNAELVRGTVGCETNNYGTISGGTFEEAVEVDAASGAEAKIEGGTFEKGMTLMNDDASITISDGLFDGEVFTGICRFPLSISGGLFTKAVDVSHVYNPTDLSITGGYFVSKPTVPNGSDIAFTSVSDQNGGAFHVPVNGDWSKDGYNKLYVPADRLSSPTPLP